MELLKIESTKQTPEIDFNNKTGVLLIRGRSMSENSFEFFKEVNLWIEEYLNSPVEETIVKIHLEYFNTSSSKCILEIFKKLKKINDIQDKNINIKWFYDEDDEEMMETGEDYQDITDLPFEILIANE
jgi:hypothetical protein